SGFHHLFVRRKGGIWRPRSPREQGREWHETLVSTAPERQPHILQWGSTGSWLF
ncbi:unnamed protein product, partial [Pylaiella littoralis]